MRLHPAEGGEEPPKGRGAEHKLKGNDLFTEYMFLPRALQLLHSGSGEAAAPRPMSTHNITPLLAGYLRKRGLTKTLKALIAETSFVSFDLRL
jgi:hypothetical protein